MTKIAVRDVSLFVDVIGDGPPVVFMHGGPGLDNWSLLPFRRLADEFKLVFYDHRCNGRSDGPPLTSMTWENLTADADALREKLGFKKWAVLGHSFGGNVAMEYALRYPGRLSHLILLDTGGDSRWQQENSPRVMAARGWSPEKVELVRRWFNGEFAPHEFLPMVRRIGPAYASHPSLLATARELARGEWRMKPRADAHIYAGRELLPGWSVMGRLGEINVPTLVMAGRDDFVFPPEHQAQLAAGIPGAHLRLIDDAGHNPQSEQTDETIAAVRAFLRGEMSDADESREALLAGVHG